MKTENWKSFGFFNGDNHIVFIIIMKDLQYCGIFQTTLSIIIIYKTVDQCFQ